MFSCIWSYSVKYYNTLPPHHMFVEELIHLLIEIHQQFFKHVVSCHFSSSKNIEGIV